jgi:RNA polymerase sigma-70 factor (ECF subfamily)
MNWPIALVSQSADIPLGETVELVDVFGHIAREHAAGIYRLAFRLSGSDADAQDLAQETFLRAWRGIRSFRGESRVRTWLIRILVNVAGEKARRKRMVRLTEEAGDRGRGDPGEDMARRDLVRRVLGAVHALPRRQREAMLLRVRGELSYRDIGEVMGIRPAVVKLHLVAARKRLAAKFGREIEDWGLGKR